MAAAVERDRARATLGFVQHVLHGLELAVRPNRPEIGIDDVIDQRREAVQALLTRAALRSVEIAGEHAGRVDVAERVAIGRGRGERAPTDPAASASAVLDRHGLAEDGLEIPGKQSRRDVAAAACGVWHDHQNPAGGKLLREGRTVSDDGQRRRARGCEETTPADGRNHIRPPPLWSE